jgi:hypothetical protein
MPFTHRTTVPKGAAQHLSHEIRDRPVLFQHAEARADSKGAVRKSLFILSGLAGECPGTLRRDPLSRRDQEV